MENEAEQALRDERAETKRRQMLGEKIPKLILKMALPTTLSQLIAVIYSMVDTFFVSGISTEATASVSIGFSLLSLLGHSASVRILAPPLASFPILLVPAPVPASPYLRHATLGESVLSSAIALHLLSRRN